MKKTKDPHDELSLYVDRIVRPIFEKVAKEMPLNRLSVGGGRSNQKDVGLYCPHFYRLYMSFSKENFNPVPLNRPTFKGSVDVTYQSKNHGSEHEYRNFFGCRITVKKNQIEVQNYIDHKKNYVVDIGEGAKIQTIDIIRRKDIECLKALKEFIKVYGGSSDLKILKRKAEHKVFGTNGINTLPIKATFHNEVVKKVYNERNVEYHDPVFAVNHLINSGCIEVVPSLVKAFSSLAYNVNPLRTLKGLIKTLDDVSKHQDLILKLSNYERKQLSKWLYTLQEGCV